MTIQYGPHGQRWHDRHQANGDKMLTPEELDEMQQRLNQQLEYVRSLPTGPMWKIDPAFSDGVQKLLDHIREQEKIIAELKSGVSRVSKSD